VNEQRAFWEGIRRSIMQMIATLAKTRPDDRYTLEVRIVERHDVS
jgi:hypothetical protein